jgi:hypothetical protein
MELDGYLGNDTKQYTKFCGWPSPPPLLISAAKFTEQIRIKHWHLERSLIVYSRGVKYAYESA